MELPSISVVTPSYNQGAFIDATIHSVLDEEYPKLEYQIMDGGSSDGTVEILRRYENRLRWVSQKDGGQGAAVNAGFERTSGEVIGWLNSDDLYAPGALHAVGAYFRDHPDVEWLYGRCPIVDSEGRLYKGWITRYKEFWARRYSWRRLLIENYLSQPAVFFRRRLLERVGPLDPRYQCAMDYDLWLRMGAVSKPAFLDRELARFRVSGVNKMSTLFAQSFAEEIEIARRVADGHHPVLMTLHEINRYKLLAAYTLLAAIQEIRS